MSLAKFVKVGSISNLSDARYCAGMGVDLLGFSVVPGQPDYITPKQFQEIRGWITGPKIVSEIYGLQAGGGLDPILENFRPDFLELGLDELALLGTTSLPLILSVPATKLDLLEGQPLRAKIAYVLVTDFKNTATLPADIAVLIDLSYIALDDIDKSYSSCGVALTGSAEIRPGLKTYGQLADVLEKLDED